MKQAMEKCATGWPACGASDCGQPAHWHDGIGIGWCLHHADECIDGGPYRAESLDDFNQDWLRGMLSEPRPEARDIALLRRQGRGDRPGVLGHVRAVVDGETLILRTWSRKCGGHWGYQVLTPEALQVGLWKPERVKDQRWSETFMADARPTVSS